MRGQRARAQDMGDGKNRVMGGEEEEGMNVCFVRVNAVR